MSVRQGFVWKLFWKYNLALTHTFRIVCYCSMIYDCNNLYFSQRSQFFVVCSRSHDKCELFLPPIPQPCWLAAAGVWVSWHASHDRQDEKSWSHAGHDPCHESDNWHIEHWYNKVLFANLQYCYIVDFQLRCDNDLTTTNVIPSVLVNKKIKL